MFDPSRPGTLVVVGTGIALVAHTTLETLDCIKHADRLLYLVTEPATESWLRQLNGSAETLHDCYAAGRSRLESYGEMVERMLAAVRTGASVCAAFYGHPGVFVNPGHEAIRRARREGFQARMLPAVSAEDCLFADLGVDPVDSGCQSYEATDFLAYRRRIDPTSALILWQAGVLGEASVARRGGGRPQRIARLTAALRRHYDARHPVVLYEAAVFPVCRPRIRRVTLANLPKTRIGSMVTLYIPPKPSRAADPAVMRWFDEE
ncbi:MAG TPA: SAM-dependent methyltransferase [Vicinamibacterales bacterium]|nr:SAM-dependent methyltransferase [Vicinamibacterales bacterium]